MGLTPSNEGNEKYGDKSCIMVCTFFNCSLHHFSKSVDLTFPTLTSREIILILIMQVQICVSMESKHINLIGIVNFM